jgi:hypothetical protein
MPKKYFVCACAALAFSFACRESEQPAMAPANGNLYDSPGTRPPRHDDAPGSGGGTSSSSSIMDLGPLADAGTGIGGTGGAGGMPIGGVYNASSSRPGVDNGYSPVGPQ